MKRQGGFTLIELVVVIVILGILAVTAAPRFLNLQNDAREASLDGLSGAIKGAVGIVYGKAAIQGVESSTTATNVSLNAAGTQTVSTINGYPVATTAALSQVVEGIGAANSNADFEEIRTGGTGTALWVSYGLDDYTQRCVVYTMAADADTPATVTISTDATNVCSPEASTN